MAAANTFDVTSTTVGQLIGHTTISASTSPTSTTVTSWIDEDASEICAALRFLSIDPTAITSSSTDADLDLYYQCRKHLNQTVAARWYAANQMADSELARSYREQYRAWMDRLTLEVAKTTGDARGSGWRHPYTSDTERITKWSRKRSYR